MKMFQILLMGCILHLTQATNDSRQDFDPGDLESVFSNINIIWDEALFPTMDITQKQIIDTFCSGTAVNVIEIPFLSNESNAILESFLNATKNRSFGKFSVIEPIIIITGIVSNFLTILYIPLKKNLRKPFYYCIMNLALGDTIALLVNPYCHNMILLLLQPGPCTVSVYRFILETINRFSKLFSEMGVLILGFVRFLLFVHPIKSRIYLTKYRVLLSFFFSFVISAAYGYLTNYFISDTKGVQYIIAISIVDGLSFILLLVIFLVLFYYRYKAARTSVSAQNTKLPMTVVTIIILALNASRVAASLVNNFRYLFMSNQYPMFNILDSYFAIASAIVHSVNPLIYFIKFNAARQICITCLPEGKK